MGQILRRWNQSWPTSLIIVTTGVIRNALCHPSNLTKAVYQQWKLYAACVSYISNRFSTINSYNQHQIWRSTANINNTMSKLTIYPWKPRSSTDNNTNVCVKCQVLTPTADSRNSMTMGTYFDRQSRIIDFHQTDWGADRGLRWDFRNLSEFMELADDLESITTGTDLYLCRFKICNWHVP